MKFTIIVFFSCCFLFSQEYFETKLLPLTSSYSAFGNRVSLNYPYILISDGGDDEKGENSGALYIYKWEKQKLLFINKIFANDAAENDYFGTASLLEGDLFIAGKNSNKGAIYHYKKQGDNFIYQRQIRPDSTSTRFGQFILQTEDYLITSSISFNPFISSYVYFFDKNDSLKLKLKFTRQNGYYKDRFGEYIAVNKDLIAVSAVTDTVNGVTSGSVYFFQKVAEDSVVELGKIYPEDGRELELFGQSTTFFNEYFICGGGEAFSHQTGRVIIYEKNGNGWRKVQEINAPDDSSDNSFGSSLSLSENRLLVGSYLGMENNIRIGKAYLYTFENAFWKFDRKFIALDGGDWEYYGRSVAIENDLIVIGANAAKINGINTGATYVYTEQEPLTAVKDKIIIDDYKLYQNFPNPFNPSTTIKYQIPKNGFVTLKVYDILGKEVKNLVNEYKTNGRYEVMFNAADLVSGVYFYQIKVNDYTANKKLMLVK